MERTPGPPARQLARRIVRQRQDPLRLFSGLVATYGDVVRYRLAGHDFYILRRPEHVEHIFVSNQGKYAKSFQYRLLAIGLGEGLLTSGGERWARQRRLIQPMFAKRHLDVFAGPMTAAATDALAGWKNVPDGGRLDVAAAMNKMTLDVVGRALFGADLTEAAVRIGPALTVVLRGAIQAARLVVLAPGVLSYGTPLMERMPGRWFKRLRDSLGELDAVVAELIDVRHGAAEPGDDLLGLLLTARDPETGRGMSRCQIRDELMTFLLAGHETTANALNWTWYLLSLHVEARRRLLAEVTEVPDGRIPTAGDVERLVWTNAVVSEAMRLYPPAWILQRQATEDDEIDGHHVPAGSLVTVPPYLVHRHPDVWPNPEGFDPERFMPGADEGRHRLAYIPFGAGRRICVGAGFARLEAVLLTAMIAQRCTFDLLPGARIRPEATVTLRPRDGLPMTLHWREPPGI
ncbi:cytochrome P450 [Actinomadura fulvescens]|uniref:Cytochrome P450 n=1 Tax=Actinomadura fulvescens TaxID=46160 RepID=A0ABN3PIY5_9ACTN